MSSCDILNFGEYSSKTISLEQGMLCPLATLSTPSFLASFCSRCSIYLCILFIFSHYSQQHSHLFKVHPPPFSYERPWLCFSLFARARLKVWLKYYWGLTQLALALLLRFLVESAAHLDGVP